ncbi:hypothetical protein Vretimale_20111 [Volvox reticuliferus]|uniref:Uncharacterized protein n=1 Tax=Volvox reticuliferus TaxID=1737510 RepID=A0A8J4H0G3_9CHLO|nr:hypothetical protein Vretimale_20111 [Volvox reticuliferus]GIM17538.1 hypothetical protein Vretimale_20111 [Volvox reticuliferus]
MPTATKHQHGYCDPWDGAMTHGLAATKDANGPVVSNVPPSPPPVTPPVVTLHLVTPSIPPPVTNQVFLRFSHNLGLRCRQHVITSDFATLWPSDFATLCPRCRQHVTSDSATLWPSMPPARYL